MVEGSLNDDFSLKGILARVWPFFLVLGVFWAVSVVWWATWGYHGTFAHLNAYRSDWTDSLALYVFTHFADGLILPGIIFLLFWRSNPSMAITAFVAIMLTGLLAQFGKLVLFPDWHRPPVVFSGDPSIWIAHPAPPSSRSFPSGHSTSAATAGVFFALWAAAWRRWAPVAVGLFTLVVAGTRVVIGVHFPGDVFVGTVLGALGGLLAMRWLYPPLSGWLGRLRVARSARVAGVVMVVSVLVIIAQYIHLLMEY